MSKPDTYSKPRQCQYCDAEFTKRSAYWTHTLDHEDRGDEPRGAGADPAGRPDPRTHPEYWTE